MEILEAQGIEKIRKHPLQSVIASFVFIYFAKRNEMKKWADYEMKSS